MPIAMISKVALVRCTDYRAQTLDNALSEALGLIGGWETFIKPGDCVLIKPNFIAPRPPEVPAQTDGRLILAIARQLKPLAGRILVGDSTAWGSARKNASLVGLNEENLASAGAEIVEFNRPVRVMIDTPAGPRRVCLDQTVLEADKIINVPKLKAHQQLVLSGALKNAFGAVVGKRKAWWHCRYGEDAADFTQMIVGVYQAITPVLNIVDAVVAMQGQGPINGKPKQIGALLGATDAAAVDRVCAELIGLDGQLEMLNAAKRSGAGATELEDIELVGESLEGLRVDDFAFAVMMPLAFTPLRVCQSIFRQLRILMRERREKRRK
ncbi:MAG: DUF362 domain-containing protein [Actinobacteria bacterium]|nr:DUF362 domain-containing protein [Actinomycetota bacterium]